MRLLEFLHAFLRTFAAKPREIVDILHEGSKKARAFAQKTMAEVRAVINLEP